VAFQEDVGFMELVYILLPSDRICRRCKEKKLPVVIIRELETEISLCSVRPVGGRNLA
jgi:hypothetical protein